MEDSWRVGEGEAKLKSEGDQPNVWWDGVLNRKRKEGEAEWACWWDIKDSARKQWISRFDSWRKVSSAIL